MIKGYNNIPADFDWLFQYPANLDAYAQYLSQLGPNENGLRLPGGQEDINEGRLLTEEFVDNFVELCLAGNVKNVILKANFYDIDGAKMAYRKLEEAQISIIVEASNEPYMGRNVAWDFDGNIQLVQQAFITRRFLWFTWREFSEIEYYKLLGKRYAERTKNLIREFANSGIDIKNKLSLAMPVPSIHKYKVFYDEVLNYMIPSEYSAITYHIYGNPEERDRLDVYKREINSRHPNVKDKILSESAAIHWGVNGNTDHVNLYGSLTHLIMKAELEEFANEIAAKYLYRHSGFGTVPNRLFHEVLFSDQQGNYTIRV